MIKLLDMDGEQANVEPGRDRDEIAVLRVVEEAFGVNLDYSSADEWTTVGDIWDALLKQLPDGVSQDPDTWTCFRESLSRETGMDPKRVTLKSGLVAENGLWVQVGKGTEFLWMLVIGAVVLLVWWL